MSNISQTKNNYKALQRFRTISRHSLEYKYSIAGDTAGTELILLKRLGKLTKQICVLLNIEPVTLKNTSTKNSYLLIQKMIKDSRHIQRAIKSLSS
jgi:hypothetical protein